MKITTKEVFQWNKKTEKYDSIECESYEYSGEVALCGYMDSNWWFGPNSLWYQIKPKKASFGGAEFDWTFDDVKTKFIVGPGTDLPEEEDILKYGIIAVAAYMLLKK